MVRYPNAHTSFKSVNKFLGIPFATPPIGELRLRAPKPPQDWKPKVRLAKEHGDSCFQPKRFEFYFKRYAASAYNFTYSEDCLYLDVYTPTTNLRLPVLVYIHGGAFLGGTAITFNSDILVLHGVVVVVIQYRLGPFGFLTTGNSAAPGNFGMLDQVEALKWVKENIEHFGGWSEMSSVLSSLPPRGRMTFQTIWRGPQQGHNIWRKCWWIECRLTPSVTIMGGSLPPSHCREWCRFKPFRDSANFFWPPFR